MPPDRADVVVIGSGAAGAAVTWRLATYGASVLCLEQGDWLRPDDFASSGPWLSCCPSSKAPIARR